VFWAHLLGKSFSIFSLLANVCFSRELDYHNLSCTMWHPPGMKMGSSNELIIGTSLWHHRKSGWWLADCGLCARGDDCSLCSPHSSGYCRACNLVSWILTLYVITCGMYATLVQKKKSKLVSTTGTVVQWVAVGICVPEWIVATSLWCWSDYMQQATITSFSCSLTFSRLL
jgi:hypothetical protein